MKISYPDERAISIWIGQFPNENDFDKSVDFNVTSKLGLDVEIESICEISFEPNPVTIRQLLEGFSGWEAFIDAAEAKANSSGCLQANAALVCYYLKCEDAPSNWGDLQFLGTFVGQDVS